MIDLGQHFAAPGPQRRQRALGQFALIAELGQQLEDAGDDNVLAALTVGVQPLEDHIFAGLIDAGAD